MSGWTINGWVRWLVAVVVEVPVLIGIHFGVKAWLRRRPSAAPDQPRAQEQQPHPSSGRRNSSSGRRNSNNNGRRRGSSHGRGNLRGYCPDERKGGVMETGSSFYVSVRPVRSLATY